MWAEAKRLYPTDSIKKILSPRDKPKVSFTKNGMVKKVTGYEYAFWAPIPAELFTKIGEKVTVEPDESMLTYELAKVVSLSRWINVRESQ